MKNRIMLIDNHNATVIGTFYKLNPSEADNVYYKHHYNNVACIMHHDINRDDSEFDFRFDYAIPDLCEHIALFLIDNKFECYDTYMEMYQYLASNLIGGGSIYIRNNSDLNVLSELLKLSLHINEIYKHKIKLSHYCWDNDFKYKDENTYTYIPVKFKIHVDIDYKFNPYKFRDLKDSWKNTEDLIKQSVDMGNDLTYIEIYQSNITLSDLFNDISIDANNYDLSMKFLRMLDRYRDDLDLIHNGKKEIKASNDVVVKPKQSKINSFLRSFCDLIGA